MRLNGAPSGNRGDTRRKKFAGMFVVSRGTLRAPRGVRVAEKATRIETSREGGSPFRGINRWSGLHWTANS